MDFFGGLCYYYYGIILMSISIDKKGICTMKKAKKLLALVLSLLMIVSMFAIVPMSASAEEGESAEPASRLENWNGNITTLLQIKPQNDETRSEPQEDGYYLTLSETDLYVGDKIKTNDQWLDYELNCGGSMGKMNNDAAVYVEGISAAVFRSALSQGKINGWDDNEAVTLSWPGKYTVYAKLDNNQTATLIEFTVKELPRAFEKADGTTVFDGNKTVQFTYPKYEFTETDLYVGDSIQRADQGTKWFNNTNYITDFTYTDESGATTDYKGYTAGVWIINDSDGSSTKIDTWATNSNPVILTEAGTYTFRMIFEYIQGLDSSTKLTVERKFQVKEMTRNYVNFNGESAYSPEEISVIPGGTLNLSVGEFFVGDSLYNGTNGDWWMNEKYNINFTYENVDYIGQATALIITAPSAENNGYFGTWMGQSFNYIFKEAGEYTIGTKMENVKLADGSAAESTVIESVDLFTINVKECPHAYSLTETVAPTCVDQGYDLYTCAHCSGTKQDNLVDATGIHEFELTQTVPVTCVTNGYSLYTCKNCDATEERDIVEASGSHNFAFTETVAPTCTTEGYDLYTCADCEETEKREIVPVIAHTYEFTETVAPTCTTEGYDLHTCSVCQGTKQENIVPVIAHTNELTESFSPSCDSNGYDLYTCTVCGGTTKENVVLATGHELTLTGTVVSCAKCDFEKEYTGESSTITYDVKDTTGATGYISIDAPAAFVGDKIAPASCWWYPNYTFNYGDYSGKVCYTWLVYGDMEYFENFVPLRAEDDTYSDENVRELQVGYTGMEAFEFTKAGTYTLIMTLEYAENSSYLSHVIPIQLATIEVYDKPQLPGDLDNDQVFEADDLLIAQQHLLGLSTVENTAILDMNKDNKFDAVDLVLLQFKILGQ